MTPTFTSRRDRVGALRREAAFAAADAGLTGTEASTLNLAGSCEDPVYRHLRGLPDPVMVKLGLEAETPALQRVYVRCRRCPECLAWKGRMWSARAVDETAMSYRTWFGTLTMRPALHMRCLALARRWTRDKWGTDFEELDEAEQYKQVVKIANREITLFLKRVRKQSRAKVRYLIVNEKHKSGLPHWHILLHECESDAPVRKALLEAQWLAGYSHWRLVNPADPKEAFYACKYISKEIANRVRASFGYGRSRKGAQLGRLMAGPLRDDEGNEIDC